MRVPLESRARARRNIDSIVERHFRRARSTRHELLVCHGNLIRALVSRALGVKLATWLAMDIHHCGITRIAVQHDGSTRLVAFNDTGHLPVELITAS